MSEIAAAESPAPAPAPAAKLEHCPNCNAILHGPYCYACGQSKRGLIRHFSSIIGDFFDTVFNVDSRTMRTLGPLYLRPGYLSTEYFAGRRVRYVTPLRLYVFLSLIAFLLISMITPPLKPEQVGVGDEERGQVTPAERDRKLAEIDRTLRFLPDAERARVRADVALELDKRVIVAPTKPNTQRATTKAEAGGAPAKSDTPADPTKPASPTTSAKPPRSDGDEDLDVSFNGKRWDPKTNPLTFGWLTEGMNASLNAEIAEVVAKAKRIDDDPGPFVKQLYATAPQALFVILPLFALLLKIFYVFKRRLYMEHLIVALHSHSFIMLSLLFAIALVKLEEWTARVPVLPGLFRLLFVLGWIWVPVYLFLMQKRVYRQGWIMTTLKFLVIGFVYLFLLVFGMLATVLVSLVLL